MDERIKADITARVRAIVADELSVDEATVVDGARLADDLGGDSLDLVSLTQRLDEAFGTNTDDIDLSTLRTFGDVVRLVEKQLAESGDATAGLKA